jgi:hypothetical protein
MTRQRIRRGVFRSIADLQGRHQRLSCRAQRQPQALPLDQIRRCHPRQTRPLPCTNRLIQCTSTSFPKLRTYGSDREVNRDPCWSSARRWRLRPSSGHDLLSRHFRLVAFDLPGFEGSPANTSSQDMPELAPRGMAKELAAVPALPRIARTFTSAPRISLVAQTSSGEPPSESAD